MADRIRYEDLTAPERAALDAWRRGSADTTGMLYAVRHALAAAGPTVVPDARQRLARHLYLTEHTDEWAPRMWDLPQHVNQEPYLRRADTIPRRHHRQGELTMCGCIGHTVCGYHTQLITDLIERLNEADRDRDDLAAAGLRLELKSYGRKVDTVRQQLTRQEPRR